LSESIRSRSHNVAQSSPAQPPQKINKMKTQKENK
jgi:hypothetical protein